MARVRLWVELLIPDTTATTTIHALRRMYGARVSKLRRRDYYEFEVSGDADSFCDRIKKVDVLVNANKHMATTMKDDEKPEGKLGEEDEVCVLVQERGENATGLMSTLRERLGFSEIKSMRRGVFWCIGVGGDRCLADEIARKLLHNRHYQEYTII